MKKGILYSIVAILFLVGAFTSCKKDNSDDKPTDPVLPEGDFVAIFGNDTIVIDSVQRSASWGKTVGNGIAKVLYTSYNIPYNSNMYGTIYVRLGHHIHTDGVLSDTMFYNYIKTGPGQQSYFWAGVVNQTASTYDVMIQFQDTMGLWRADNVQQPAGTYFEILDTTHSIDNNSHTPRVDFTAKFKCLLKNDDGIHEKYFICNQYKSHFISE